MLALPADAAITAGTINFGTGHASFDPVSTDYNGLTFTGQWSYYTYGDLVTVATNRDGDAITSYSMAGDATIKSANGSDRFSITSVKIAAYGAGMTSFTFVGYRSGTPGPSETVNVTASMYSNFVVANLTSMTNVDEVRITNNSPSEGGNFAFDDLVVAPYSASLSLSPASLTNPTVGTAYSQTITASGGNGSYSYAVTAGALPAGLSLNGSSGVLSGTPTAGGSFSFTVTATDTASATGSKAYTVTVAAATISFSPANLTAGSVGNAYSQSISASGGTAPYGSYILKTGALPAGLSLSSAGVVSGTPTSGGTFSFTVQATDSSSGSGPYSGISSNISLTIAAPTLSFSPTTLATGTVGTAYSQSISGSGGTAPYGNFTLASGSLPPGLTLAASGALSGTPTAGGIYTFTVSAQDSSTGSGPYSGSSSSISLTIGAPTLALSPASLPAAARTSAYSQTLSTSGGTSPYTYSITAGSLPAGLSLSSAGVLSGTPTAEGSFSFTITSTDSSAGTQYSASRAYSLLVNPPLAVANAVSATVAYNSSGTTITLNITGGTASSVAVAGAASHGTATASGTSISYTPTSGYSGSDSFTYTATNASGTSAAATVSITINPQVPTANAVSTTVAFNSTNNTITLSITGGAATSVAVASAASHGTATASGTSITYTPSNGYAGADSFTYAATNATGTSAAATVSITVNPLAPVANAASSSVAYNSTNNTITLNITGGVATSVTVASGASHGTATASGTSITYTPTNGYAGTDSFTYTATNAAGTSAAATVSVTVNPQVPVANAVSLTVSYNSVANPVSLSITGLATTVAVAGAASHGTATASGTSIFYTPTTGYAGSDSFTYTANNAGGTSSPATVTVTVNPQAPVTNAVTLTMAYNSSGNNVPLSITGGTAASVAVASGASHGTATASGTNISYTPTPGYSGPDSFTYTATNVTGTSAPATVTITVSAAAPVANAVSKTVAFNSTANPITLSLGGGTPTSVAVATAAGHGTASASGTNITYTPATGYAGNDSFTYTASNATGTSAAATVSITVNPDAPVAGSVTLTVPINSSNNPIALNLSGGAATAVSVVSAAAHGTATASGASITYTPTAGYSGNDSFSYTATNVTGTSAPASVSIAVQSRPDPSKDVEVTGLIKAQVESANRFAQAQIGNFQSHLEGLHRRASRSGFGLSATTNRRGGPSPEAANSNMAEPQIAAFLTRTASNATRSSAQAGPTLFGEQNAMQDNLGLDPFALPQNRVTAPNMSAASLLPWSLSSLNLAGKHEDVLGSGLVVWTGGVISVGKQNDTDTRFTTSGISVGVDKRLSDELILGVGGGLGHENQKVGDNGTHNTGNSYSFVIYGSYQPTEAIFIDGLVGHGSLDFDTRRHIGALGSNANASRTGKQWFSSLSGGYDYVYGKSLLSSYSRLDLVSNRLQQSTETGAGIYNLTYFEQNFSTTKLSFGIRGETRIELSNGIVRPFFRVEYQHAFDRPETARMAYADELQTVYQLDVNGTDRDTAVFGLGGDLLLKDSLNLGFSYRYSLGSESTRMHTLGIQLKKGF